jgi:cyclohexadieny/prephenate dehydrogenase
MTHANAEGIPFQAIGIVGCGLIGCSIAAALKKRGFSGRIVGCGRPGKNLETALERRLIDRAESDLAKAAAGCDLIVICTPVDRIVEDVRTAAGGAKPGTLITDAGSAKDSICRAIGDLPAGVTFIGSHPIAGSEKQGCAHADPDLFVGRVCVLTPAPETSHAETSPPETSRAEITRLAAFWQALGMSVVEMSPEAHDRALAQTSHVPHVVAAALATILETDNYSLTAGGFQDTTRIAAGDPELWTAILLANADEVAAGLRTFSASLQDLLRAIDSRDKRQLTELLTIAKRNRDGLTSKTDEPARDANSKGVG